MTKRKATTIPKPRKAIPVTASPDPDEAGHRYAKAITSPEVVAYRVTMACELPELTNQVDVPGMLKMFKGTSNNARFSLNPAAKQ